MMEPERPAALLDSRTGPDPKLGNAGLLGGRCDGFIGKDQFTARASPWLGSAIWFLLACFLVCVCVSLLGDPASTSSLEAFRCRDVVKLPYKNYSSSRFVLVHSQDTHTNTQTKESSHMGLHGNHYNNSNCRSRSSFCSRVYMHSLPVAPRVCFTSATLSCKVPNDCCWFLYFRPENHPTVWNRIKRKVAFKK
jgi:hypothetical protein